MTDDEKRILHTILDTQEMCLKALVENKIQIDALTYALIRLDSRVATLYSEQLEIEQKKQAASLEKNLKELALLRATVSAKVQ